MPSDHKSCDSYTILLSTAQSTLNSVSHCSANRPYLSRDSLLKKPLSWVFNSTSCVPLGQKLVSTQYWPKQLIAKLEGKYFNFRDYGIACSKAYSASSCYRRSRSFLQSGQLLFLPYPPSTSIMHWPLHCSSLDDSLHPKTPIMGSPIGTSAAILAINLQLSKCLY